MKDHTVVICGLCRDARHFLPRTAARIERLGQMFRDYQVVIFENDSVDATSEFLTDWQTANHRIDVMSQTLGTVRYPQTRDLNRAERMAYYRNQYRKRAIESHGDADFVIVVDMDLPGGWSYDGIAHSFGHDHWDFVGSYGICRRLELVTMPFPFIHFDIWAYHPAEGTEARKLIDHSMLSLRRGMPLMPVESCFGGLGVYRMECLRLCEYGGTDCEHVVLHENMRRAGFDRLFMNPNQIVLYSPG